MRIEYKNMPGGIIDVSTTSRQVKVGWNKVEVKDHDNDVIEKKAYEKTIKERGPEGTQLIWALVDHDASMKSAIGKPKEMGIDSNGYLYAVTDILDTYLGNDMMKHYMAGTINQHSIGFSSVRKSAEKDSEGEYTLIKEVKLYEGSIVLWGANPYTPTFSVGKSLTKKEAEDELEATLKEYDKFTNLFRKGTLTDESFGLVEIRISQLNDKIKALFNLQATQAVEETPAPDGIKSELEQLSEFTNYLKLRF